MDTSMSRANSHAFASCSNSCAPQIGSRWQTAQTHRQHMARPQPIASQRQTTVIASSKKESESFNPFRNKKKEVG